MLTEECFGLSGINLLNHAINQQGPFSDTAKYIRDNNSPDEINFVMDKFLAYLLENGFTCENLKDPNFIIDYLTNDYTEIEGMVGGMPVKPLVVAVLITFNVASGNLLTDAVSGSAMTAGILIKRTFYIAHSICTGFVIPAVKTVGDVGWEIGAAADEVYERVLKSPTQKNVDEAQENERKAMAAAAALAEKVRLLEEAVEKAKEKAAEKEKAEKAKADKDKANLKIAGVVAGSLSAVAVCVFGYSGLNTRCEDKTGPLPKVNYNKIARNRPIKYRFADGYNSEYTFTTLEEACTAASEGYPLYVNRDGIWMKLTRWDDLIYCFGQQPKEIVATKNHEMPRKGGTKRRKKRRSTRRR